MAGLVARIEPGSVRLLTAQDTCDLGKLPKGLGGAALVEQIPLGSQNDGGVAAAEQRLDWIGEQPGPPVSISVHGPLHMNRNLGFRLVVLSDYTSSRLQWSCSSA